MWRYLLEKEFKQLFRNLFLLRLVIMFPLMVMLVLPWAANMEVKEVGLVVVDDDHSVLSRRLTEKFRNSENFRFKESYSSYEEAVSVLEYGKADVILVIPYSFEKKLMRGEPVEVEVSANTVNGMKGSLGSSYAVSILNSFGTEVKTEAGPLKGNIAEIRVLNRFNPHMEYKVFMVPALMVMVLTMLCGFLPALSIVSEKEKGTIEQINVTPVGKFTFIFAKLVPFWLIGFLVLSFCFLLARLIYGLSPSGSLLTIYAFAALYILTVSGLGLVISNYSDTMQQAVFVIFFFVIVFLLMSGLFTPIRSMPEWAQTITIFNPLKYFIQVMRQVYLKGSVFSDLYPQAVALIGFALFFNGWAVLSYRKRN